jgi:methylated-DNA-protein-cysteine methyltransferase-like protein
MPSHKQGKKTYQRIYALVRRIPMGKVMTYGQVASLAALPNGARVVGYAMAAAPEDVPWQRVVGKSRAGYGRISLRDSVYADIQRQLLVGEGLSFNAKGEIDLSRFGVS